MSGAGGHWHQAAPGGRQKTGKRGGGGWLGWDFALELTAAEALGAPKGYCIMRIWTKSSGGSRSALFVLLSGGLVAANGCLSRASPVGPDNAYDGVLTRTEDAGEPVGGGGFTFIGPPGPQGAFDADIPGCPPVAPAPDFGTPVTCATPPPPISGGTLLLSRDGSEAFASDPDRNAVYVVDLGSQTLKVTIALQPGDEPGRLAEDGAGRIHVALRGSGTLATLDPISGTVTARRAVCPAPRGVAWQASNDTVWVACATGELASMPSVGNTVSVKYVDRDLRDVILNGDAIAVTQFRSSQVLRLAPDLTFSAVNSMSMVVNGFASHVVWRAVAGPGGGLVAIHQVESTQSVSAKLHGGYGGGCGGGPPPVPLKVTISLDGGALSDDASPVGGDLSNDAGAPFGATKPVEFLSFMPTASEISVLDSTGTTTNRVDFSAVLPVDVAISPDGKTMAAVAAGSGTGSATIENLFTFNGNFRGGRVVEGQAVAVAFDASGGLLVQTREPAALWFISQAGAASSISLSSLSVRDTGHDIFHTHAGALIACATCHPEGGDDGHVWILDGNKRRTPSLRGTIAGTAPYHWPGDEPDFAAIVKDVYEGRMSGGALTQDQTAALSAWVNAIPAPPAPTWVDSSAAAAGRTLFQRGDVGCTSCHSGAKFTNNATVDVGTGGAFQVPPLVGVGWRTPLMHDGCAATIADRFGACATAQHGNIASLSKTDVANLTAYLETL
jgi:hypothetical protein